MRAAGKGDEIDIPLDERRTALKSQFEKNFGYWNACWDGLLKLDPDFFAAYLEWSSIPWRQGRLEPKVKEFIGIAINAATTHLYESGLRIHIQNALKYGATKEEIMEVYQLISGLGMHTCTVGIPALLDELRNAGQPA
jgi:alkylhydroperoxidase/carboxymuconolactone decarboxylase family protein YurZ